MNKTLLSDDSSTMRRVITRILRQSGISVATILEEANGLEGLEQVVSHSDVQLIHSDVDTPEMDGIGFVHKMREPYSKAQMPSS